MRHPLEIATSQVSWMKQTSELLGVVDRRSNKDFLLKLSAGEAHELQQAVELWNTPHASIEHIYDELNDIWVLVASWLLAFDHVPDFKLVTPDTVNFNGFGKSSNAFEKVGEMILGLEENPEDIYHVMTHLFSIAKHLPIPNIMFEGFVKTIDKVLANRPPQLYTAYDPFFKRVLTPDEALGKYDHLEKMTRMLRAAVDRKLHPTDWQQYSLLMQNWQNAETNQMFLGKILAGERPVGISSHLNELQIRANAN